MTPHLYAGRVEPPSENPEVQRHRHTSPGFSDHLGQAVAGTSADEDGGVTTPRPKQPDEERYARGLRILRRIGGEDYDGPIKRLAQTSPDLSRFTVEYPYGDILSRPGLDL